MDQHNHERREIMAKDKSSVTITIPVSDEKPVGYEKDLLDQGSVSLGGDGNLNLRVNLGKPEARAFQRIRAALRASRAILGDGKPVFNNNDVLRWLCQQVVSQSA